MPQDPKRNGEIRLPPPPAAVRGASSNGSSARAQARALGTPLDFRGRNVSGAAADTGEGFDTEPAASAPPGPRQAATETLAQRAGALSDEIDFSEFVSGLVHGTFDAIVDASIRQMETFGDLVSAVAKSVDEFAESNVSLDQARDWLLEQYPQDLYLDRAGTRRVAPRSNGEEPASPAWLAEYGLEGEELSAELIEDELIPRARRKVGQSRQQMLATMVLLGMNRVVVRDGTIAAKLRFRAAASDRAKVDYALSDDPSAASSWGARGSKMYSLPSTKVSTVGVNVQADSDLRAELFGEVKINFASETLPLDRFVDEARRTLLERNARPPSAPRGTSPQAAPAPAPAAPAPAAASTEEPAPAALVPAPAGAPPRGP
jgi:hypothetical protein